MRLLLDACVWGGAVSELVAAGHDVEWAGSWDDDPGDEEILARARSEARILVTLDKDFGELAVVRGIPHAGIVRLVHVRARDQARLCREVLERHGSDLQAGALVTAAAQRLRVRPPERP